MIIQTVEKIVASFESKYKKFPKPKDLARRELKRYLRKTRDGDGGIFGGWNYGWLDQLDDFYFHDKYLGAGLANYFANMYSTNEVYVMTSKYYKSKEDFWNAKKKDLDETREKTLTNLSTYFTEKKGQKNYRENLEKLIEKWKSTRPDTARYY